MKSRATRFTDGYTPAKCSARVVARTRKYCSPLFFDLPLALSGSTPSGV